MARVIYRVLDSTNPHITILDEFTLRRGDSEKMAQYYRALFFEAKDNGLLLGGGIFDNGVCWFKAMTKGGTSVRRYEIHGYVSPFKAKKEN